MWCKKDSKFKFVGKAEIKNTIAVVNYIHLITNNRPNNFHTRKQQDHVKTAAVEYESSHVFQIGNKSNTPPVLMTLR